MRRKWPLVAGLAAFTLSYLIGTSRQRAAAPLGAAAAPPPAALWSGLGDVHHPIANAGREAQAFFDQGLALDYGFNFIEAVHSFQRAAALAPKSPMPWWGVALARGPNFNDTNISPAREMAGYRAITRALALSGSAPAEEQAYVHALAARFGSDPWGSRQPLAANYAEKMRALREAYPDDPDAAVLYAESLMDLDAWDLWTRAGLAGPNTNEIIAVLQSVLTRWPENLGANHLFVHALEASPYPERAIESARRLEHLAPASGHIVHMPAHLYFRLGDYADAVASTQAAAKADDLYDARKTISNASYRIGYAEHNLLFEATAAAMDGDFGAAMSAALKLDQGASPGPEGAAYRSARYLVLVRFRRWQAVLGLPLPPESSPIETFFARYARGCALAAHGHAAEASAELVKMELDLAGVPGPVLPHMGRMSDITTLALDGLRARIAQTRGQLGSAVDLWRAAVAIEDSMPYHEPPPWYPVRESLAAALLRGGELGAAEAVLDAALVRDPRDPRALFLRSQVFSAGNEAALAARDRGRALANWRGAIKEIGAGAP